MKAINFFYVVATLALGSTNAFSKGTGSVVNVAYAGIPLAVDIAVCTNINDPVTCETHHTTNNKVTLTPAVTNFYYKYMGVKVLTPGYIVQNSQGTLTPNRYGYVSTPGSSSTPAVLQIGESTLACNGLTAINLGDGVNWRCYDLPANSKISCTSPPKTNCTTVNAPVPTVDQIQALYSAFGVDYSPNIFTQPGHAAITNMPYNPFTGQSMLLIYSSVNITAASWSTDWGSTNFIEASQQLCPCES